MNLKILAILLEKFPTFNPEWPDYLRQQWLDLFGQLWSEAIEAESTDEKEETP